MISRAEIYFKAQDRKIFLKDFKNLRYFLDIMLKENKNFKNYFFA